jgi:glutamate carboxypeptidase
MNQILDHLQTRQEIMTQMLQHLVMLDSPSHDPAAVNTVGDTLAESFGKLGALVERLPAAGFGHHLRVSWGHGDRQILLLGHMDTVWPVGETALRPFLVADHASNTPQRATGPGIFDMKGGLVIGLSAVAALHDLGLVPAHRLVFVLNSDEEVGSPTSRPFIEEEARRSDSALVLEPSREDALVTWRKGVGRFSLEIEGLATHSGAAHERGISAVTELAHQILHLEAMTDYERGTTVSVGVVRGGSEVNVRPASARAEIDLRVTNDSEARRMTQAIHGLQPKDPGTTLHVSGEMNRPPWDTSPGGQALFEQARGVVPDWVWTCGPPVRAVARMATLRPPWASPLWMGWA